MRAVLEVPVVAINYVPHVNDNVLHIGYGAACLGVSPAFERHDYDD